MSLDNKSTIGALFVLLLAGLAATGPGRGSQAPGQNTRATDISSSRTVAAAAEIPVQACTQPAADAALVRNRRLAGAIQAGPLVIYPIVDLARNPLGVGPGPDVAPPVVLIPNGFQPVTLTVGASARERFSLLFGGATTGRAGTGFRVADGIPAIRLPACERGPVGFRGGFLYRPTPQCVPITVRTADAPALHATIAIGRPPASCPDALHPRRH